jgi:hypothetical protein
MCSDQLSAICAAQLCDNGCDMLTLSRAMLRSTLHADVTADAVAQCTAIRALLEQAV